MACHDALLCFLFWRKRPQTVCANLCGFAYILRLLRTFVYAFYVRIRIFRTFVSIFWARCVAFTYVYSFFLRTLCGFCYVYGFCAKILMRTVSKDPILRFPWFLLSVKTLVIHGQSRGSNIEGYVDFFFRVSCLLLSDIIEDPILRVPLSSLSAWSARDSPSYLASEVYCWSW